MRYGVLVIAFSLALAGCAVTRPVVVISEKGQVLKGTATGSMSGSSFQVTDGRLTCAGNYNGLSTELTISMQVVCNDGRKGIVVATRETNGLNGQGTVTLSDGTQGKFVFGDAATAF